MTRFVAIIGYPLGHSISPPFQQAAFDYYRLDIRYEKWPTEAPHLEATIDHLRQPSILGANITIPYKEAVAPLLDELDEASSRIGAVNTVVNQSGKLLGYNTDAPGFMRALREDGGFEPRDKCAALLGAGGVARAVGFALTGERLGHLIIVNRKVERAEGLAVSLRRSATTRTEISIVPWEEMALSRTLSQCDLVVNCTPLGMKGSSAEKETPLKADLIPRHVLVCDLVYNPVETLLLQEARKAGARALGGLAMLVYQGAASFTLWVGKEAPVDIMYKRAKQALGED